MCKKIEFEVTRDYFHLAPVTELYQILREVQKETCSNIHVKTSYDCMTRPAEYIFNGKGGFLNLLDQLINTKQGKTVQFSFEPDVSDKYLDKFREKIKHLF